MTANGAPSHDKNRLRTENRASFFISSHINESAKKSGCFSPKHGAPGMPKGKPRTASRERRKKSFGPAALANFPQFFLPILAKFFLFYPAGLAHSSRTAPPAALFIQMVDKAPERPFPLFIPLKHAGIGEDADKFVPDFKFYNFFRIRGRNRRAVFPF